MIFATCFLHMMPEVYESTVELKKYGYIQTHYPFSQLVVSIGFFLVYFIEEIAHYFVSQVTDEEICHRKNKNKPSATTQSAFKITQVSAASNKITPEVLDLDKEEECQDEGVDLPSPTSSPDNTEPDPESQNITDEKQSETEEQMKVDEMADTEEVSQVAELDKLMKSKALTHQQIIRGILIVLALSLHGFFEGLAIGLQSSIGNIWYLFIAVSIHSATILFVISLELILANAKLKIIVIHVLILSIVCPVGVLLGTAATLGTNTESKVKTVAVVILEGLSAGTITYITFFEVLNREKARRVYRLRRAASIILGFCLMACLECFEMYY